MQLTARDLAKLLLVHPDLRKVVLEAARTTSVPFVLGETLRSLGQQKKNVVAGVSWTLKSRHLLAPDGLVYAVDIMPSVNGKASWSWPLYYKLAPIIKLAATNVGVTVEWGGDWKKNKDGPHWQLGWAKYPGKTAVKKKTAP